MSSIEFSLFLMYERQRLALWPKEIHRAASLQRVRFVFGGLSGLDDDDAPLRRGVERIGVTVDAGVIGEHRKWLRLLFRGFEMPGGQ